MSNSGETEDSKNVVVLVLDSLRKDRISPYNEEVDFTDNMEELAQTSDVYRNVTAQAPWTLPSHASMFTGEYPWEHGATQRNIHLETEKKVLAERFQEKGYHTELITPNAWISPSKGTSKGFDGVENFLGLVGGGRIQTFFEKLTKLFDGLEKSRREKLASYFNSLTETIIQDLNKSRKTVEETKKFLEEVGEDEDFFLFVNLMSPHEPYNPEDPPEEYLEKHGVEDYSEVPDTEEDYLRGLDNDEEIWKAYNAAVDYTDDLVGEIHQSIMENGHEDDTVFVVLSDHGQALGDDGVYSHQFTVADSVVKALLMIERPRQEDSRQIDGMYELRQLYDLIPEVAGISDENVEAREKIMGGYEFPEFFMGWVPDEKKEEFDRKLRFVTKGGKKIVKSVARDGEESYRMRDAETGEELEVEEEMRREVDQLGDTSKKSDMDVEDEEVKQRLEELGYM
jgi:arylsulfatase A-like enzyme